jgi:hypothetical protein
MDSCLRRNDKHKISEYISVNLRLIKMIIVFLRGLSKTVLISVNLCLKKSV